MVTEFRPGQKIVTIPDFGMQVMQPAVGAFLPSDLANLALWLDADAITGLNDGDTVATWVDQSENGNDGTGNGTPIYKVNIVNSKPIVRFNGADAYFALPNFASGFTAATIFIVIAIDNDPPTAGRTGIWWFGTDATSHFPWTDGVIYDCFGTTLRKTVGDPAPSLTDWHVYEVSTASGAWTCWLDNIQLFTIGVNTVSFTATPMLGARPIAIHLDGDVAEVVMYSDAKDAADRALVRDYLNAKYGL